MIFTRTNADTLLYFTCEARLIPSYICFCLASIFLLILNTRSSCPSPLYRTKSFMFHLKSLLLPSSQTQQEDDQTINPHEGIQEIQVRNLKKKKMIEANKRLKNRIAHVRREMQQILAALSDLSLDTSENSGYNPLSRLLPVQLILRGKFYIRVFIKGNTFLSRIAFNQESNVIIWCTLFLQISCTIFVL